MVATIFEFVSCNDTTQIHHLLVHRFQGPMALGARGGGAGDGAPRPPYTPTAAGALALASGRSARLPAVGNPAHRYGLKALLALYALVHSVPRPAHAPAGAAASAYGQLSRLGEQRARGALRVLERVHRRGRETREGIAAEARAHGGRRGPQDPPAPPARPRDGRGCCSCPARRGPGRRTTWRRRGLRGDSP